MRCLYSHRTHACSIDVACGALMVGRCVLLPCAHYITDGFGIAAPSSAAEIVLMGLGTCAQVPPNYDSLLGKLIVWGEDRTQAIARMKRALNELVISGVPTTTQYHEMILEIDDFVNGNVDTGFIPKHADQLTDPPPPKTSVRTLYPCVLL